jgi:hypothetical protein
MDIIVIGGGCYGTLQTHRLLKAMERGIIPEARILIIDRNVEPKASIEFSAQSRVHIVRGEWSEFLKSYFRTYREDGSQLIPAHIAPHLLLNVSASLISEWSHTRYRTMAVDEKFNLPFEKSVNGVKYISAAAWLCPFSCIEPHICPAISRERTWDLSRLVKEKMSASGKLTAVFKTEHYAWGVGSIQSDEISRTLHVLAERIGSAGGGSVAVATTSNCHGVVGLIEFS